MKFVKIFNKENLFKLIRKPQRIIPFLKFKIISYFDKNKDLKLKEIASFKKLDIYKNSILAIERIVKVSNKNELNVSVLERTNMNTKHNCSQLKDLFDMYGSDKATIHNYDILYYDILSEKIESKINLLEIGIGTNNLDTLSNMGKAGKPGASLRAFRDFLPNANIYGADIDRRILFTEERISTFFIDQTDINVLEFTKNYLNNLKFDLIIDDGLHTTEANLNTLLLAIDLLSENGFFVIEDIDEKDLVFYEIVAKFLNGKYRTRFYKAKNGCLFVLENN